MPRTVPDAGVPGGPRKVQYGRRCPAARALTAYGSAVADTANDIRYPEIDIDEPETVGCWQHLAALNHLAADVGYNP
jgi:hypothetical protein